MISLEISEKLLPKISFLETEDFLEKIKHLLTTFIALGGSALFSEPGFGAPWTTGRGSKKTTITLTMKSCIRDHLKM